MQFYLAPMEGNTGYIFRNAIHEYYGAHIDKYFIPFIEPHTKRSFNSRERNDILPEHNAGMHAIPQLLTKNADDFLRVEADLLAYGYDEININLGCPSGTVVSRGRGAGMLENTKALDDFLYEIFAHTNAKISLKTRIGLADVEEFAPILDVYNKYELEELIIHPRLQKEMYKPLIHPDQFQYAMEHSKNPLCYNGDIVSVSSYDKIMEQFHTSDTAKEIHAVMLGRGMLKNPNLINDLAVASPTAPDLETLRAFCDRLLEDYSATLSGDRNVLFRMKELWSNLAFLFPDQPRQLKAIQKAQTVADYRIAVRAIL